MKNKAVSKLTGKQSISIDNPVEFIGWGSIAGKKEGEGPLGKYFDVIEEDPMFGGDSWEDGESRMQKQAAELAIKHAGCQKEEINFLVGGDLLGQLIATSFGIESLNIPFLGVYGACSTMGESILVGSILVEGGYADKIVALTSSHFGGAEKQFRFPLAYGSQRPVAATWTVTGSGAVVLGREKCKQKAEQGEKKIFVKRVTIGKIVDYGVKDSLNMGACMAPSAADTIFAHLSDFSLTPDYYDRIVTGDLGSVGKQILIDLLADKGCNIKENHMDCGIEIFDAESQSTGAGGSGCGCSAITLTGYILKNMLNGVWKRILFVPTGALLSTVSYNEGQSVPGIAHAVALEVM